MQSSSTPGASGPRAAAPPDMLDAVLLYGPQKLTPAHLTISAANEGQILLRVRRAGICGSDIHYFLHGRAGRFVPKAPFVSGHEFAGDVVALGANVPPALLGRRVAVDPSIPCAACFHCRSGHCNPCRDMRFFGSASCDPHING